MILECPNCGTYYDTPAIIPPEGRRVRCAKCANTWLAMPSPSEASETADELELSELERDDAESSAQATAEPEEAGEAVASDESTGDEGSDEGSDEGLGEVIAEDETEARFSVEEEEPESSVIDAPGTAPDEAAAEEAAVDASLEAAADAEMAEPGDAPEQSPVGDEAASEPEPAAPMAEDDEQAPEVEEEAPEPTDETPEAEAEVREPTDEVLQAEDEQSRAEDEAPPPEADFPIGDFSHRGAGPARSPMQEILATAADSQPVDQVADEGPDEPDAADDRPQSAEPAGSEATAAVDAATEPEAAEISPSEAADPSPVIPPDREAERPAADAEIEPAEPEADVEAGDEETTGDQPAAPMPAATMDEYFQPSTGQLVSWAALALLVVIGFTLAVVNREAVVRAMPGSASFYGGLGLAVNLRGLDFENVTSTWSMESTQPVLEVSGEIVNITDEQIAVPTVVFALHDEDGVEVHQWEAEVTDKPLEAGGRTQFTARIPSPPTSSKSVQVKFAEAQ